MAVLDSAPSQGGATKGGGMTDPSGVGTVDEAADSGAPIVIHGLAGLQERAGQTVGASGWKTVEQDDITTFAKLTGDEQWIHVDPERAASWPFGATIQLGFLTLGMSTCLLWSVCTVDVYGMILNYALN